jgi:hypothetical protein
MKTRLRYVLASFCISFYFLVKFFLCLSLFFSCSLSLHSLTTDASRAMDAREHFHDDLPTIHLVFLAGLALFMLTKDALRAHTGSRGRREHGAWPVCMNVSVCVCM